MGAKRVDLALSLVSGEVAYKLVFSPSKHLSPTDILFFARILNIKWLWSNIIPCLAYCGVSGTAPEALCFQSPVLRDSPQLYPTSINATANIGRIFHWRISSVVPIVQKVEHPKQRHFNYKWEALTQNTRQNMIAGEKQCSCEKLRNTATPEW